MSLSASNSWASASMLFPLGSYKDELFRVWSDTTNMVIIEGRPIKESSSEMCVDHKVKRRNSVMPTDEIGMIDNITIWVSGNDLCL
jgi:hypothetical protein